MKFHRLLAVLQTDWLQVVAVSARVSDRFRYPKYFLVIGTVSLQAICALAVIYNFIAEVSGPIRDPMSWRMREILEISANVGLLIGAFFGAVLMVQLIRRNNKVEGQLLVVSGEFHKMLRAHFQEWGLSPSETDVAYFAIKGLSNGEIAQMRGTSEGTIKAQLNAVYKKASVEGRTQLLGYFIEELMA